MEKNPKYQLTSFLLAALVVVAMGCAGSVFAQNTFPTSGNAGINTPSPPARNLDIVNTTGEGIRVRAAGGESSVAIQNTNGGLYAGVSSLGYPFFGLQDGSGGYRAAWITGNVNNADASFYGNVGIGTTSPGTKLDIAGGGAVRIQGGGEFQAWFDATPSSATRYAARNGYAGIGTFNGSAWNDDQLVIKNNGNVGIGTTSPASPLEVIGLGNLAGVLVTGGSGTVDAVLGAKSVASGGKQWDFISSGSGSGLTPGSMTLYNRTDNVAGLSILSNGWAGIGTTSPVAYLDVNGARDTTSYIVGRFSSIHSGYGAYLSFSDGFAYNFGIGTSTAGDFTFNSSLFPGSAGTERMRVTQSGNVGIGTASPASRLQVNVASGKNVFVSDYGTGEAALGFSSTLTAGNYALLGIGSDTVLNRPSGGALRFRENNADQMIVTSGGNVGIGTSSPGQKLDVLGGNINVSSSGGVGGNITITGTINAKYQDVAEWVPASAHLAAGTVVVLDSTKSNQVTSSSTSYDTRVAGVVSEQPGIALGEKSEGKVLVATTGRVRVKVDASKGPIHIGDLLVTSDTPGVAMKSEPVEFAGRKMHMPGTLIGKALEPLEKGKGEILVLLSLQ